MLSDEPKLPEGDDVKQLLELSWAFVPYHALRAAIQEDLFLLIESEHFTVDTLATKKGWQLRHTNALLKLLESLGFVICSEDIKNTDLTKKWLLKESPHYFGDFFLRNSILEESYHNLEKILATGVAPEKLQRHVQQSFGLGSTTTSTDTIVQFGQPMVAASLEIFNALIREFPIDPHWKILDVGGGLGALEKVLFENGHQETVDLLETSAVAEAAKRELSYLGDRVRYAVQNWHDWDPEPHYDLVMLSHVLHEENSIEAKKLLKKAAQALKPQGKLVVIGFDDPQLSSIFRINLLLEMNSDLPTTEWLRTSFLEVGVKEQSTFSLPGGRCAWIATKI